MAGIKFDITGDNKNLLNSAKQAQTGVVNAINSIERAGKGIESTFSSIKNSVLGGFTDIAKGMAGLTALMQGGNFIKELIADAGKFKVAMKEVSTLSEDVATNLQKYVDQVADMTTQIPIGATEAAKALYQIESAGHHGADGLNVLRESAKGAIGGVTDTATTADAITTILNAYNMEASQAQHVSDLLFTTVRLGKTNMSQLGTTIAQVAPVAASFDVSIEDVLAAIASLTKQGTKTSVAVRQVRDAITATTKSMGDSAFQGRSFLDAMDEVAQKAQGSNNALRQDLGTLQALNAVLALTGKNSQAARQDVADMQNSAGAAEAAYQKMASSAGTQVTLLRNNIFKAILPLADEMRDMSSDIARYMNEAFDSGAMDKALVSLEAFIAAYATYRGMLAASTAWNTAALGGTYKAQIAELQKLIPLKELDGQADLQAAVAKGTLTTEQAKLVASLRAETEARYEEVVAAETEARANLKALTAAEASATANVTAAEEMVASAQARLVAATQSGVATEIETAKEELNTAEMLRNDAVRKKTIITRQMEGAQTMVSVTSKNAETAATLMNTTQQGVNATATGILATAKLHLAAAIDAVNASFLASPLFWIAAAIAGVTFAVYKLVTAETANEEAIRKANEAMDEQKKKLDERKSTIEGLLRTISDPNATDYQKIKAYDALKQVASDLTDAYSREALATMEAAKAQKILNESMDEAEYNGLVEEVKKAEKAYKDALAAREAAKTSSEYGYYDPGADYSGRELAKAKKQLELARQHLEDAERIREEARKAADDAATPIEIRIEAAKENEAEQKRIFDFYDDVMSRVDDIQDSHNKLNFDEAKSKLDDYISEVEAELADLHTQAEQNPIDKKIRLKEEEKTNLLNKLLLWKRQMATGGYTTIPLMFKADWGSAKAALNAATSLYQNLLNQTTVGDTKSMADLYEAAKTDYETALKEWKRVSNKKNAPFITQEEYNKAKTNLATAKSSFEAVGGDPDGKLAKESQKKAAELAKENAAQRGKLFEQEMSERQRHAKQLEALKDAQSAAAIAKEQNRVKRELLQAEKDHQDRMTAIDQQAEEMRKANYEAQKKAWEAANTDNTKSWADTDIAKDVAANGYKNIQLTKEQIATLKALREKENADYANIVKERFDAERQSMIDYLKEYGTFQQQRLAIAQEYAKKIAEAEAGGNKWEVKRLTAERDSRIAQANAQSLAMNIDWNQTFQGIGNVLQDIAKETLQKVNDYMTTAEFKGLDAAAKKAYSDLKQTLIDAGGQTASNPFSSQTWDEIADLTEQYKSHVKALAEESEKHTAAVTDYQKAVDKEKQARADLEAAIKAQASHLGKADQGEYDKAVEEARQNLADATQGVADTFQQMQETGEAVQQQQTDVNNTQQNLHQKTEAAAQGLNNFNTVLGQLTSGTLTGFVNGVSNVINALTKKTDDDMQGLIGVIGKKAGGIIGAILSIIDMLGDKPVEFFDNLLDGIAKVVEAVISHIPEIIASIIKGVGSIVGSIFSGIGGLFGIGAVDNSAYEAALDKWGGILDAWESNVKYERELMEKAYGVKAIDYSRQALKALEDAQKAASEIYKGWASSGAGWFSHSHGYETNRDTNWKYLWDYDEDLAKLLGVQEKYWIGGNKIYTGGDVSKLFDLTWEQLEQLQNRAPQFWASMSEDARKYLENFIEAGKTAQETIDALNEQLTTTTKENIFDDFLNSLYDLADGSEGVMDDIASNWKKMVNRMVINNTIGAEFQEEVKKWYERLASLQEEYTNGGMKDAAYKEQLDSLYADYEAMVEKAEAKMEDFTKRGIIQPIQNAGEKAFSSMRDSFLSALTDMNSGMLDFMEDFVNTTVSELVDKYILDDDFAKWMNDWKQKYSSIINDKSLPEEVRIKRLKALMSELADKQDELSEKARVWTEAFKIPENVFADLADSFKEAILDMEQTADDFVGFLRTNFRKAITNAFVMTPEVKRQIEEWVQRANELTNPTYKGEKYEALKSRFDDPELGWIFDYLKQTLVDWNELDMTEIATGGLDALRAAVEAIGGDFEVLQATIESFGYQPEEAEAILNEFIQLIAALDSLEYSDADRTSDIEAHANALKALFESVEASQEYWDKILGFGKDSVDTSPFENVRDTFLDTLTDIEGDAEKFKENLVKTLTKDLIEKLVLDVPITLTVKRRGEDGSIEELADQVFDNFNAYSDNWNTAYLDGMKELKDARQALNDARASGDEEAIKAAEARYNAANAYIDALIDELVELEAMTAKDAEEFKQRMRKAALDTTFTDMESNFVSTLMDMEGDVKDFANDIKKTIVQKLVEAFLVSEKIKPLLDDLQKTFNHAMGLTFEGMTTEEATKERAKVIAEGYTDENGERHQGVDDITGVLEPIKLVVNELLTAMGYVAKEGETLFSNLGDTILESLLDVSSGVEGFMDSITQTITEDLVKSYMATDEFQDGLKTVKDDLEAAVKALADAKTPEEIAAAEEQLKNAKKAAEDFYNEAVDGTKRFTDALKKIENDTTFKDMTGNWVSNLMDFNATAEDWAEEIGQTMAQKIIEQMIVPTMIQPLLDNIQKAFNDAMATNTTSDAEGNAVYNWKGVLNDEGLKASITALQDAYPELKDVVQQILSLSGVKPDFSNSLDSLGDTLLDRLLSLDDDVEDIGKQIGQTLIREMLEQMLSTGQYADRIAAIKKMWQAILTGEDTEHTIEDVLKDIEQLENDITNPENSDFSGLIAKYKSLADVAKEGFSDLRGAFLSSLIDMNGDAETFGKNIGRTMLEQMLDAYIESTYKEQIAAINKEWAEALQSGNTDALERIKQKVQELYSTISTDVEVSNIADAIKELDKQLDTTFSDMADSLTSTLMDMEATAEDWAQSVGKMIAEKIIKSMVIPTMIQPILDTMQKAWNAAAEQEGATYQTMLDAMMPYVGQLVGAYEELRPIADYILNSLGVYKETLEEVAEEVEYHLQDMKSNFASTLMDMKGTAEDWSRSISEILAEAFIKDIVLGDAFDAQMKDWQAHYESILNSGLSEEDRLKQMKLLRDAIVSAKEGYVEQAMAIQELLGLNVASSNQTATANIADKATYEQEDKLIGINMAQEMTLEQILYTLRGGIGVTGVGLGLASSSNSETARQIESTLNSMGGLTSSDSETIREIRGLIIIGNSYLYDIKTSNEQMLRQFGERLESIDGKIGQIF